MQRAARRANNPDDMLFFLKSALHSYFKQVFDVSRASAKKMSEKVASKQESDVAELLENE